MWKTHAVVPWGRVDIVSEMRRPMFHLMVEWGMDIEWGMDTFWKSVTITMVPEVVEASSVAFVKISFFSESLGFDI